MSISVIIPAYNEAAGIASTLEDVQRFVPDAEVIVVDDGSADGTGEIAAATGARVIRHRTNRGYGAALKTGIRAAHSERIVLFDADGQHRAHHIPALVALLEDFDLVVGERTNAYRVAGARLPGKIILGWVVNVLGGTSIKDINCGFRAAQREELTRILPLLPDGFSFSTTSTLAYLKLGRGVGFTPVETRHRVGKSTVNPLRDGYRTIMLIVRLMALFDPLRVFLPVAIGLVTLGVVYGTYMMIVKGAGIPVGAMVFITTGMVSFLLGVVCDQISALRLERYAE
ncbi:MAG: glycosyltransferase family 2 protein [Anaerolineae bacterium]|nr:glycosyltransferase family 2 protein [Anaerolineae bacterium]